MSSMREAEHDTRVMSARAVRLEGSIASLARALKRQQTSQLHDAKALPDPARLHFHTRFPFAFRQNSWWGWREFGGVLLFFSMKLSLNQFCLTTVVSPGSCSLQSCWIGVSGTHHVSRIHHVNLRIACQPIQSGSIPFRREPVCHTHRLSCSTCILVVSLNIIPLPYPSFHHDPSENNTQREFLDPPARLAGFVERIR